MITKFQKVLVPLCGEFYIPYISEPPCVAPAINAGIWDELIGTPRTRKGRRACYAAATVFQSARIGDRQVVGLLGVLARSARATPLRREVLRLCEEITSSGRTADLNPSLPEWESLRQLLALKVAIPTHGSSWAIKDYASDIQLVKLLSKYPFKGSLDRAEDEAVKRFLDQEATNSLTNDKWREASDFTADEESVVEAVFSHLEQILGPAPTLDEILENAAWGPGTINGYPFDGDLTGAEMKFGATLTCTPMLIPLAEQVIQQYPAWASYIETLGGIGNAVTACAWDQLFTVLKQFELNRCALKQQGINAWLQRGVGVIIRKRLQKAGLTLVSQQNRNRLFARVGSFTGLFATIDLRSASDSICRLVLKSVTTPAWFTTLFATVAREYRLPPGFCERNSRDPNQSLKYEMISSMGCGYTFELESALFLAIARSVVPGVWLRSDGQGRVRTKLSWPNIGVYGDDIIVPSAYAPKLMDRLRFFGLSVNDAKSHTGREPGFRESCGGDYLFGCPVRPLYFTKRLDNGPAIVSAANRVLEVAAARAEDFGGDDRYLDRSYRGLWLALCQSIPERVRPAIQTPPNVPGGLWMVEARESDSLSGTPPSWWVFAEQTRSVNLAKCSFWFSRRELWPVPANGDNLLAARLMPGVDESQLSESVVSRGSVPIWALTVSERSQLLLDERKRYGDSTVGVGETTYARKSDVVGKVAPTLSAMIARSRWHGWN